MYKMERIKVMIVGLIFLNLALCVKSTHYGEHATLLGFILIFTIVVGPTILSHEWKHHNSKELKT